MSSIGQSLRTARDQQDRTVDEVAGVLGVPVEWLKDLEEGHFEAFGNEVHVQAAIRLYARELGLRADDLLAGSGELVRSTGATFEPRIAAEPTRADVMRAAFSQSLRSSDGTKRLGTLIGLEILAGIGMIIVRSG